MRVSRRFTPARYPQHPHTDPTLVLCPTHLRAAKYYRSDEVLCSSKPGPRGVLTRFVFAGADIRYGSCGRRVIDGGTLPSPVGSWRAGLVLIAQRRIFFPLSQRTWVHRAVLSSIPKDSHNLRRSSPHDSPARQTFDPHRSGASGLSQKEPGRDLGSSRMESTSHFGCIQRDASQSGSTGISTCEQ